MVSVTVTSGIAVVAAATGGSVATSTLDVKVGRIVGSEVGATSGPDTTLTTITAAITKNASTMLMLRTATMIVTPRLPPLPSVGPALFESWYCVMGST
jgi:hypothetical protein